MALLALTYPTKFLTVSRIFFSPQPFKVDLRVFGRGQYEDEATSQPFAYKPPLVSGVLKRSYRITLVLCPLFAHLHTSVSTYPTPESTFGESNFHSDLNLELHCKKPHIYKAGSTEH
ncbi:hypothetical protein VTL71DRAFT_5263 [Oculimacula yallundae]|uniref:Uncharacterized protein n=1 Tax=Oculimacula yallundae TaxID=86028 RepID=A0ABR4C345_9HELO